MDAYYMIPFWLVILVILKLRFGTCTAVLLASVLFGAVDLLRPNKIETSTWKKLISGHSMIGHRGCALNAPENTLASIHEAHRLGAKAVELDVRFSLDNVPVIIHDSAVDRTTNGTGVVSEMTWSQLKELDASCKDDKAEEFKGETIPDLKSALQLCKTLGMTVYLDLCVNSPSKMAEHLLDMYTAYPDLHEWVVAASFYPTVLHEVKRQMPHLAAILTHRPHAITYTSITRETYRDEGWLYKLLGPPADWLSNLLFYHFWWYFCGVDAVFIHVDVFNMEEVRYWHTRGLTVFAWTVNNPATKPYLTSCGVTYITDDCAEPYH